MKVRDERHVSGDLAAEAALGGTIKRDRVIT
jgi:hypothetical protein